MTAILGISAFYHDSAAALVVDGEIVAAAQEERFSRKKHDHRFPAHAVDYCLEAGGLTPEQLDYVGFYDKPLLKFDRLLETYLSFAPQGFRSFLEAMPLWLRQKLHLPREMSRALGNRYRKAYVFTEHHESHAASAFFPSPFDEAAILTMDGVGEWATASFGVGRGHQIRLSHELRFPHSLGLLYSAFTYYCGFEVNSGEYKLMGLAPYGEPRYADLILERLVDLKEDGSFRLDLSYFNYCQGLTMTNERFHELFGGPPRGSGQVTDRHMDVAASVQKVTEEIVMRMARHVHAETGLKKLCLAGGVALNCVANGRLLEEGPFEDVWVQPAAGDAGGALGVALFIWHQLLQKPRVARPGDSQRGSLLGPSFTDAQIREFLDSQRAVYRYVPDTAALCDFIADRLAEGQVIGWFQGPMEFGPRALGSRSLLGDPRNPTMQSDMNLKVKFRESFRPFAPAVLREHVHEYFGTRPSEDSPYMLFVAPVREERRLSVPPEAATRRGIDKLLTLRSVIPAVTHVDYSARIQTVDAERHGLYHRVIDAFHRKTGCPVIVNTSFNLGWDPIVCSPKDAYDTFMACEIDTLCMGHTVLTKAEQPAARWGHAATPVAAYTDAPWCCPCGRRAALSLADGGLLCSACGRRFAADGGVALLYWEGEGSTQGAAAAGRVDAFYERTPFPDYAKHETLRSLIDKGRRSPYARLLDAALPPNSRVLEVGCGTGELTNFLGIACREVVGIDVCANSLQLGEQFRARHGLHRVRFAQMNLAHPCLRPGQFDVILCSRVLNATADPLSALAQLVPLLRPGGHVILGLDNQLGRALSGLRGAGAGDGRFQEIEPQRQPPPDGHMRWRAWFGSRVQEPGRASHTVAEALEWLGRAGLDVVRTLPSSAGGTPPSAGQLFTDETPGGAWHRFAAPVKGFGGDRGGFFLVVGRRPLAAAAAEPVRRAS